MHQKNHCHRRRQEGEDSETEEDDEAGVEEEYGEEDGGEGHLRVAGALGLLNDDNQAILGARRRTGNWRQ